MRGAAFGLTVGAAALLAGCDGGATASAPAAAVEPVLVSVAEAVPAAGGGAISATGTVRAKRETALSFTAPGRVAAVLVDEGDRVARGQLLARLDPSAINAGAAAARAELVRADAEAKRLRGLASEGWVTRPRVEAAEAAAAAARAQVASSSFDARFSRIVAPASGVVLRRHAEANQTLAAGSPVVTIGEASGGHVLRLELADADAARLRVGQGAAVSLPALGDRPLAGTVSEIGARGDDRTGTFRVEIALPGSAALRSGLIGDARIRTGGPASGAVAIPATAVFAARADEGFVYVVAQGDKPAARVRLVRLGPVDDREVVVTAGLAPGDRIATSGLERLSDGAAVRIGRPAR